MQNKDADIKIQNGMVVTCNAVGDILDNGGIVIKQGRIAAVGTMEDLNSWTAKETIDATGCVVMPGLVNAHTHLPMSLFRGLADDIPLMTWLNDYIFPAEAAHITPETVRIGALLSCAELLLSGTTTCCDGYFYEDSVAEAVFETGIRCIAGQGVIDYPAPGVPDPLKNIAAAISYVEKWAGRTSLITPSIFCHSPYTCSKETLVRSRNEAAFRGVLFQIHLAETKSEYDQIKKTHGVSPVTYLDIINVLRPGTLLVHAVWVDEDDRKRIADRGAGVAHNPESNMKLASGVAPIPELIRLGVPVGLGTDGSASNNNLDLFEEMSSAAKLHKVNRMDPTIMDAKTVLNMATAEGADAIGLGKVVGSLEVGKMGDVIVLDMQKPHLVPMYHPISHIVYAAKGSDVRDVIVNGKVLVKDGRLLTIDLEKLFERVAEAGRLIKK
ncbi:MAG: amidohydrolase [Deltaproteobacteria bacterium]|nr:MAG: amidohydrolase [Deltaproteobacteria bacterium]